jgi:succinoglycan biosynthesis transport protein ExoP
VRLESAPQQGPELDDAKDLQFADILKFLLRRWLVIAIAAGVGLGFGVVMYLRAPRLYTATETVEMNRDATSGLGLQDLSGAGSVLGMGQEATTEIETEQMVLSNASTALSVIHNLNLMSTPPYSSLNMPSKRGFFQDKRPSLVSPESIRMDQAIAIFRRKLSVRPVTNTRLLEVSYTDPDPQEAARIVNGVVEAYLTNHTRNRYEATTKASAWLNQQLEDLKRQTEDVHKQVASLERDSGLSTMAVMGGLGVGATSTAGGTDVASGNPDLSKLIELNQALNQAQLARIRQGTIFRLSQTNDPDALLDMSSVRTAVGGGTTLSIDSGSLQSIQKLRNQEADIKLRIAQEKVTYASKSDVMVALQNQMDSIHAQVGDQMSRLRNESKRSYTLAEQNEQAIRREVEAQQVKVSSLSNRVADLAFLREQENTSRKLYQELYSRLQEADIAAGVRSSGMAVVDPARPPSSVSSPILRKNLMTGIIAGVLFGLMVALVQQIRDTRLNTPLDFEERSPYAMLGVIPGFEFATAKTYGAGAPRSDEPANDQAWILKAPNSPISEAYRSIRTAILLARVDTPPKVLMFTSSLSGDGKSTTTYNLAVAFAVQASRVLLLDADMRRSTIAKLAGMTKGLGLSDVLSGAAKMDDVLHVNSSLPQLTIMQAGTVPPAPSELLGSQRFRDLILELRGRFDYVLIDTPPVLLVTDPIVTSTVVDAIVCVVRAGKTDKPTLRRFWEATRRPKTPVLGYIVNDFNRKLHSYAYGGYGLEQYRYYGPKEGV